VQSLTLEALAEDERSTPAALARSGKRRKA